VAVDIGAKVVAVVAVCRRGNKSKLEEKDLG